jgi:TolB-like protein/Flp pilus assembly protein TadD
VAGCRLTLLGGFGLEAGEGKLGLPTRKDRLLLAYLALSAGRPQPREKLATLLWGDRGEAQARDSLKQALAGIRQVLRQCGSDPIRADRETVTLEPAGLDVDANEFVRLATNCASFDKAAGLYQGKLLDGFDGTTADYDDWLRPERERLAGLAQRLLETVASSPSEQSAEETIRFGFRLLADDRLCEPVYRALMRLLARKGNRVEAMRLYTVCRGALKQDLGVAPDAQTEELYRDILTDRLTASPPPESRAASGRPSIAVLPFSNLSADPALAPLCEGVAEDIITGLGRFHLLFVIDRHSSAAIAQQTADVQEIGRRLGVIHLVQGSLQRQGERVRITVRLIDAVSRAQVWGEAYDIALADILAVPDKATSAIVTTLYNRVEDSVAEGSRRKPALAAYECLLRGIKHLRGYGPDDNKRALELFRQAMELDPGYALARAYCALAEVVVHNYDAPDAVRAQAHKLASTAIELDGGDSRCHWVLGQICRLSGDFDASESHYRRAIALNPNDANAIAGFGRFLASVGRWDEAIDRVREAMRINPYHPDWYWNVLGSVLYSAGKYSDAVEALAPATQRGFWNRCFQAACLAQMGRIGEAAAAVAEARRVRPDCSLASMRARDFSPSDSRRFIEDLRKAGMPE